MRIAKNMLGQYVVDDVAVTYDGEDDGPANGPLIPVDAETFLALTSKLPRAMATEAELSEIRESSVAMRLGVQFVSSDAMK